MGRISTNEKSTRAHGGASCATQLSRRLSASNRASKNSVLNLFTKRFLEKKISSNLFIGSQARIETVFLEILWWFHEKNRVKKGAIKSQKNLSKNLLQKICCRFVI